MSRQAGRRSAYAGSERAKSKDIDRPICFSGIATPVRRMLVNVRLAPLPLGVRFFIVIEYAWNAFSHFVMGIRDRIPAGQVRRGLRVNAHPRRIKRAQDRSLGGRRRSGGRYQSALLQAAREQEPTPICAYAPRYQY